MTIENLLPLRKVLRKELRDVAGHGSGPLPADSRAFRVAGPLHDARFENAYSYVSH